MASVFVHDIMDEERRIGIWRTDAWSAFCSPLLVCAREVVTKGGETSKGYLYLRDGHGLGFQVSHEVMQGFIFFLFEYFSADMASTDVAFEPATAQVQRVHPDRNPPAPVQQLISVQALSLQDICFLSHR